MAQFTVTIPDSAVTMVRAAVQKVKGLAAPATNADVGDAVREYLRALCFQVERGTRQASAEAATTTAVNTDFPS